MIRKGDPRLEIPRDPARILKIRKLLAEGMTFAEISRRLGGNSANIGSLYRKWKDWNP